MKHAFLWFIFSCAFIIYCGLEEPVPLSHRLYNLIDQLGTNNLLGDKSDLYQRGIVLTRREAASVIAVGLTEL
ncbi:MAG: hypothetical protein PHQ23_12530, partial [Candidatus Wallbacteria bacterium]|nr:hypothetical protein [Candidatus Wallbacteria bacterium]